MRGKLLLLLTACGVIFSCRPSLQPGQLYGTWDYQKIEELNHSNDSLTVLQVKEQHPTIEFNKSGELNMMWGGKLLSHGRFRLEGMNIQYTETLPDGNTRTFPFWVSEIGGGKLVFETLGRDGSRVTAKKE